MSGPVGTPPAAPNPALEQAQQNNLRQFLPADLASARGKELDINSVFVSDREIVSISHSDRGSGLETITIVTDEETITIAETAANDQYGLRLTIDDGDRQHFNMSASLVSGQLALVNRGSGALHSMTIRPGLASLHIGTSMGAVTATLRAPD